MKVSTKTETNAILPRSQRGGEGENVSLQGKTPYVTQCYATVAVARLPRPAPALSEGVGRTKQVVGAVEYAIRLIFLIKMMRRSIDRL